jgi:ribose transport system substrate-binding protein
MEERMKKIALVLLFALTACALFAGGAKDTAPAKDGAKHVAVIIKATDSDFWQYVLVGASNYGKENPDKVSYHPRSGFRGRHRQAGRHS